MKATVVEIQSKSYRLVNAPVQYRRIALQVDCGAAYGGTEIFRLPEDMIGIVGLALDDEVDVVFHIQRHEMFAESEESNKK